MGFERNSQTFERSNLGGSLSKPTILIDLIHFRLAVHGQTVFHPAWATKNVARPRAQAELQTLKADDRWAARKAQPDVTLSLGQMWYMSIRLSADDRARISASVV